MSTAKILTIYRKWGYSASDKPYTETYKIPFVELSREEFNWYTSTKDLVYRSSVYSQENLARFNLDIPVVDLGVLYYDHVSGPSSGTPTTDDWVNIYSNAYAAGITLNIQYTNLLRSTIHYTDYVDSEYQNVLCSGTYYSGGSSGGYSAGVYFGSTFATNSNSRIRAEIPIVLYIRNEDLVSAAWLGMGPNWVSINAAQNNDIPGLHILINISPEPEPGIPDPYAPGGNSTTGGGDGTFDLDSDLIGLPPLPTLSFASTGFTRIYNPSLSELNALANYLWTDTTFLDTVINHLKQLLENPMDAVISLALLPCSIPNGNPEVVKVMYISTGVSMAPATTQFVDVDCGTYTIEEFYGSALDYNPYTKVHCYLPYIGQVTLDTDEVMGKTLQVVYRIDIVTGMCAAMILVDQNVLYQFSGHCSINMPMNSADFSGYIGAAMTAGKMVAGVVAGAAGAPALAGELIGTPVPHSSTTETFEKQTARNPNTGRQVTTKTDTKISVHKSPGASFGEMARKATANTVGAVMGSKLTVEHAGGFTGNSGYLAVRRPYLIIERPRMCNPEEYGRYNGRPSMIYMNLGECVGYTEVQSIQFENIPATNPELAELSELLKSGVLF